MAKTSIEAILYNQDVLFPSVSICFLQLMHENIHSSVVLKS